MKKLLQSLLGILAVSCFLLLGVNKAQAVAVNYNALKYGTSETSMASGYYARPAQVNVVNGAYVVTMTIMTNKSLSPWPVVVNSIDGQAPQNVSKTQSGDYYLYSYSFTTNNLNRTISSNINVSIPNVYTANHNISFTFDTSSLPSLTQTQATPASQANDQNQSQASATASSQANNQSQSQANNQASAVPSSTSSSSSLASSSQASASSSSVKAKSSHQKASAKKASHKKASKKASKQATSHKEKVNVQSSRKHALRNGIIIIVVIAAIAGYVLYRAKHKEEK
ncbi:cell surface protein [Ligilactobacillus agilis]|uniref:NEAT domain-containing protein n=1 Tax=Ligilactobacillus agilis TaxID=1601 RepID=UPI001F566A04|nr:NEAT domain-containing protein [Ligilactobacillus agilis]UNL41762.1 cell surface protein [Ligilactobacillus agilis]UNL58809.1 cell surface protein [Ligilactobacillus agilis]